MSNRKDLDDTINKLGLRAAILVVVFGGVSGFFPLDAPQGEFGDRMLWYSHNLTAFTLGWAVQMIAMLILSGFFATIAWTARSSHPISSFLAGSALLISVMCFLIPKFIAIWSIPQMVEASTHMSHDAELAGQLFQLLHPSLSFSLFTSFDYLGFWMYAIFALFLVAPLYRLSTDAKIAAAIFGLFGVLYHALLLGVMFGGISPEEIGNYANMLFLLLLIPVIAMGLYFRTQVKNMADG